MRGRGPIFDSGYIDSNYCYGYSCLIMNGYMDLFASPLSISHFLELFRPLASTHVLRGRVEAVVREADGATTLVLRPGRGWAVHRAGQFVNVGIEVDGRILTRAYSLSSDPERDDGLVTITVKAQRGGRVSNAVAKLEPGDYVRLGQPQGEFVLPNPLPARILFVTGGSGITPVASMVRSLDRARATADVVHVHFAKTAAATILGCELRRHALASPRYRLEIVETARGGRHLDEALLASLVPDHHERVAFACGPEPLLEAAERILGPELRTERFRAKFSALPNDVGAARVRFGRSKKEVDAMPTRPLLEVAEGAGVQAPHGCRMGICHSCDVTLLSGCVRDLRNGTRTSEPGARIQTCVCAADGHAEIDL